MSYISARVHDSNVIQTAILMFSGSGYTIRLLWKLPDVWTNEELKMASVDRKSMYAIFDSSQIHRSSSLRSSLILLPDLENMGRAHGISLPCTEVEIYVISTSDWWPPSLIYGTPKHRTVFPFVFQCCPTPKTWAIVSESRCYLLHKRRYTTLHRYFRLMAAMFDVPVTLTSEYSH